MRRLSPLNIASILATFLLFCPAVKAQNCTTYYPNPATFPFFSTLRGAQYVTVAQVNGITQPTVMTPIPASGPGALLWDNPRNFADGVFGANGDGLFQSCGGVFPSAGPSSINPANPDFAITETVSSSNGTLNINVQGTIIVLNLNGSCPDTCLLDQGGFTQTYVYNIRSGGYSIQATASEHTIFTDNNGNTIDSTTTLNGSDSGTWPLLNVPLQITTSSLPNGQVGVSYDSGPLSATGGRPFPSVSYSYSYSWSGNTATGLPFGLVVDYFTGKVSGLPSVAGDYSATITVHDFDGTAVPKTFPVHIAANPKLSNDTIVQNSYYSMLFDYWTKIAAINYVYAQACNVAARVLPELSPLCKVYALEAAVDLYVAYTYEIKAADPADTNYMQIALPNPPSVTIPAPSASWTAAQLAAYNALVATIQTEEQIIGLSNAEMTAVNRAGGANQAGSTYWVQQQLAAQTRYSDLEAFDLDNFLAESSQLNTAYATSGFPDFSITVDQATQFELGVAANGLPSDLQEQLTTLGVDSQGLEFLQQALPSLDPNTVAGDILQAFFPPTDVATTIQQLATSFINPSGVSVVPSPPSGTACNGVYNGTFNGDITVSSGQTCTFVGGSITGNVRVTGGDLVLSNASVGGNVQINGGGVFTIAPSTIIQGNLQIQNIPLGSGLNVIDGVNVRGNLQFQNNAASVEIGLPAPFPGNVIGGHLQVQNNSVSTQIYNNAVSGNLQVQNNAAATAIYDNTVGGNLQAENNTVSTQVFNNSVTNNLQCQNDTSITGGGNTAERKRGQCSSF